MDTTTVVVPFAITAWDETPYDEPADGPPLARIEVAKRFTGALTGTSTALVTTAQGPAGAGYVATERVTGSLDGRDGTFVLQHGAMGPMDDAGAMHQWGHVVPGSGTAALAGLAGDALFARQPDDSHTLTLTYRFG